VLGTVADAEPFIVDASLDHLAVSFGPAAISGLLRSARFVHSFD